MFLGCKPYFNAHNYYYGHNQKRHHITKENDLLTDSLVIKDFIVMFLHLNERKSKVNLKKDIYDYYIIDDNHCDSIFNVFNNSLKKFELPLNKLSSSRNRLTSSFMENVDLKYKKIDQELLFLLSSEFPSQNVLIPIIRIKNDASNPAVNSNSTGVLSIFIVRDRSVLYYKSMKIKNGEPQDNKIYINQEHWDGLVHVVLWEYIEHIGLGEKYNIKTW